MTALVFDVFAASAPAGASIGTLTEAYDKEVRVHHNDLGDGGFKINRHSSQVALAAADNYVRVKLTGGSYFGGFWIETGADTLVSSEEESGEDFARAGRGSLSYLERAILMPTKTAAGSGVVGTDGNWAWTNQTIGAILTHILSDATAVSPSGVPALTWDFGVVNDSAGLPWDMIDNTFQLPIGMDILSVISRFQSGGVVIRMDHDFVLHAWNAPAGADVSGAVSFVKGVNIRESADRAVHASGAKTRVVVQGTTVAGLLKFRTVSHPTFSAPLESSVGVRYGFTQYGSTPSNTMLDRAGRQLIAKLKRQKDGPTAIGVLNTPAPFTAYKPGDTVNVNIPAGFDNLDVEVAAITLRDDDADGYVTTVEFEDAPYDPLEGIKTGVTSSSGSDGGLSGGGSGGTSGGGSGGSGGIIPPGQLGTGSDGSGNNVLHDNGTWSPCCGGTGASSGCCAPWDGVGSPASGASVLFLYIADGNGSTTAWTIPYAYMAGTLRVYFNSRNVTSTKTEVSPTAGTFSVSTAPTASPLQKVYVSFTAA